jgi:hypothetical protein
LKGFSLVLKQIREIVDVEEGSSNRKLQNEPRDRRTINWSLFSKKGKIGVFLPLCVPFNYVSLFTMSFPHCLPRCSFPLQDDMVTAEMWYCQNPLPLVMALSLKTTRNSLGEWRCG